MDSNEKLAQWAALFVSACSETDPVIAPVGNSASVPVALYPGVTPAASKLLQAVDAGGVPAFITSQLKQIAEDNGIEITGQWTPNEIVEAIRGKAQGSGSAS